MRTSESRGAGMEISGVARKPDSGHRAHLQPQIRGFKHWSTVATRTDDVGARGSSDGKGNSFYSLRWL